MLAVSLGALYLASWYLNSSRASESAEPWTSTYGHADDFSFSGHMTFAHLPASECLNEPTTEYDIAILGAPFDGLVTYRPGARFGPRGLRAGSRRQRPERAWNIAQGVNPYKAGHRIVDCGDVPLSPFDPMFAMEQLEVAYTTLLNRSSTNTRTAIPRIVTLGGDHTIVLPILRSLHKQYGKVSVIHLDAHLDTWEALPWNGGGTLNHGTFFRTASVEGLLGPSIHLGIRTRISDLQDLRDDGDLGFELISTDAIDDIGTAGIIKQTLDRVGNGPVYISLDVDVLDPAFAPATGTPESGGWTTREVKRILRGFSSLNIVGADVVEFAPAYDTQAELTAIAAADIVFEILGIMTSGKAADGARTHDEL